MDDVAARCVPADVTFAELRELGLVGARGPAPNEAVMRLANDIANKKASGELATTSIRQLAEQHGIGQNQGGFRFRAKAVSEAICTYRTALDTTELAQALDQHAEITLSGSLPRREPPVQALPFAMPPLAAPPSMAAVQSKPRQPDQAVPPKRRQKNATPYVGLDYTAREATVDARAAIEARPASADKISHEAFMKQNLAMKRELRIFWTEHGAAFSTWWQQLSASHKRQHLRAFAPHMSERARDVWMVPECTLEWLCDAFEPPPEPRRALSEDDMRAANQTLVDSGLDDLFPVTTKADGREVKDYREWDLSSRRDDHCYPSYFLRVEAWARRLGCSNPSRPSDGVGSRDYVVKWPPNARGLIWLMRTRAEMLWDDPEHLPVLEKHGFSQHADDGIDLAAVLKAWPKDGSCPTMPGLTITEDEKRSGYTFLIGPDDNSKFARGAAWITKAQEARASMERFVVSGQVCRTMHFKWLMQRQFYIYSTLLAIGQQFLELRGGSAGQHLLTPIFAHVESSAITPSASKAALEQYMQSARSRALARGYLSAGDLFLASNARAKAISRYEQALQLLLSLPDVECDLASLAVAASSYSRLMSAASAPKAVKAVELLERILADESAWSAAPEVAAQLRRELVSARASATLLEGSAEEETRSCGACHEAQLRDAFSKGQWRKAANGTARCIECMSDDLPVSSTLISLENAVLGMPVTVHEGECPICFDEYSAHEQRTLPCFDSHWLCLSCLRDLASRNRNQAILCPLCKAETKRPELDALLAERPFATAIDISSVNVAEPELAASLRTAGDGRTSDPSPGAVSAATASAVAPSEEALYQAVFEIRKAQSDLSHKQIYSQLAQTRPDLECTISAVKRASKRVGRALCDSDSTECCVGARSASETRAPGSQPPATRLQAAQPPSPRSGNGGRGGLGAAAGRKITSADLFAKVTLQELVNMERLIKQDPARAAAVLNQRGGTQYAVFRGRLAADYTRGLPRNLKVGESQPLSEVHPFELLATGIDVARVANIHGIR